MIMLTNFIRRSKKGFTLAELLIALAILGVIATFTIPKILTSSANGQNTAIAKEAASMISAAYSTYTLNNTLTTGTTAGALTQYFNYVTTDTATSYTAGASGDSALAPCTASLICLKLHNGGILQYSTAQNFGGTTSTAAITFALDPDGLGTRGKIVFVQQYGGRTTTNGQDASFTTSAAGVTTQATDPSYLTNWN
jgi:prepilin-type N-terminal cleavage/methylation domain-containing protein